MKSSAIIAGAVASPRPGLRIAQPAHEAAVTQGLELSDIEYRPLTFFSLNPANAEFRAMKPEAYLADLERDIGDVGITDPLIAMPDGLIIAGESRYLCGKRLDLDRLPVRFVLSDLSPAEQEKRLILNNVLRFEIDAATRLSLLYRIGFYDRPRKEAADALGITERQATRERGQIRRASEIAESQGKAAPDTSDFQAAREEANSARREPSTVGRKLDRICLDRALTELDARGGDFAASSAYIREALGW